MNKYDPYKAVVVCTHWISEKEFWGVLFAKRADSRAEVGDIIYGDILDLIEAHGNSVTVSTYEDVYGEWVTRVKCPDEGMFDYKLMFEENEDRESGEREEHGKA